MAEERESRIESLEKTELCLDYLAAAETEAESEVELKESLDI